MAAMRMSLSEWQCPQLAGTHLHYGYLYDFSGQPWRTQFRVRQIANDYYRNRPDGVAGNTVPQAHARPPQRQALVVSAPRNSATRLYIQAARLNGRPLDVPVVTYAQIEAGGALEFDMAPVASKWAPDWRGAPLLPVFPP